MTAATPMPPPENESAGGSGEPHGAAFQSGIDVEDSDQGRAPQEETDGYAAEAADLLSDLEDEILTPAQILLRREIPAALAAVTPPLDMFHAIEKGARDLAIHVRHGGIDFYEAEEGLLALAEARGLQKEFGHAVEIAIYNGLKTFEAPGEANGHDEAPPPAGIDDYDFSADGTGDPPPSSEPDAETDPPLVRAADLAHRPVQPQPWLVPALIPDRNVTDMPGDGGVGKTLIALQLAVAMVLGLWWLGIKLIRGPVIFYSCEDELDAVHRRLIDICTDQGCDIADLVDLHILPMAASDPVLATFDRRSGKMARTARWGQLRGHIENIKPKLVILDARADVYGGDEIIRAQVRAFVAALRRLCLENDLAVLLLSHPSIGGMASATGQSGSTAWGNSVRSRIYLERPKSDGSGEVDPYLRILSVRKSNYGEVGTEIRLRWHNGVFVADQALVSGLDRLAAAQNADSVFLDLLATFTSQGRTVSPNKSAAYAPTLFARHPDAHGVTRPALTSAMERLLKARTIIVETFGPKSKLRQRLAFRPASNRLPTASD